MLVKLKEAMLLVSTASVSEKIFYASVPPLKAAVLSEEQTNCISNFFCQ